VGATVFHEQSVDEETLRRFLKERLAKFKIPMYFQLTDKSLPRTGSGKIYKLAIQDKAVKLFSHV